MNAGPAESLFWHFPVLIVTVSLVYSATRYEEWGLILREALSWGGRMTVFLVAIGVVLALVSNLQWPTWAVVAACAAAVAVFYVLSHLMTGPSQHVRST